MGITKKHEKYFKIMGLQAWMHSFSGWNLFSFAPQAKAFLKAYHGDMTGAQEFWWYTKNYSQRSGWWNSIVMLIGYSMYAKKYPEIGGAKGIRMTIFGSLGYATEIACWVMFYVTRVDALKYAEYLIAAAAEEGQHANFI